MRVMPQGYQYKKTGGFLMKTKSKALLLTLCAVLLITASVLGTMAYLTSKDAVNNTFTVGKVEITLDETKVKTDGTAFDPAARVKANEYHLIPGHVYIKDPTVTIKEGSENSYIRMIVTINEQADLDAIFAPAGLNLTEVFGGYVPENWILFEEKEILDTRSYEFRYKETVAAPTADVVLPDLFNTITLPGTVTGTQLATLDNLKIDVVAHAIQADGFATADVAWLAYAE